MGKTQPEQLISAPCDRVELAYASGALAEMAEPLPSRLNL